MQRAQSDNKFYAFFLDVDFNVLIASPAILALTILTVIERFKLKPDKKP